MTAPLPAQSLSAVAARLRSAGCVFAEDEARLLIEAAQTPAELAAMERQRMAGQPLEHVLGWAEFCGLRIAVDPGVFVPRRRTEFLIGEAAGLLGPVPRPVIVDLCCGSGALGVALAAAAGRRVELHAADVDPAAVRCARRNVGPPAARSTRATWTARCPPGCAAGSMCCWPTCPTCPPGTSRCCPRKPASTRHGWPWTAARTAWTCCAG